MTKSADEQIMDDEGYRQFPYKCTQGFLTVGYGRNLETVGITPEEAIYLLKNDIARTTKELRKFSFWTNLDATRQAVLINMGFNLGINGLLKFHDMIMSLTRGNYSAAADAMKDSLWYKQVGERAERLCQLMRG